jgi:hypothetical protein
MGWKYKFLISERFQDGSWKAVSEDEKPLTPMPIHEYLNKLGEKGCELVAVVPAGETALTHDQLLKHILKRKD